jgi:hypothetical protein
MTFLVSYRTHPINGYLSSYDFIPLREKPLIEARPGEFICPVVPFLLSKIIDEPYFILSEYLKEPRRQQFQDAPGKADEKYAQTLVSRLAATDRCGAWQVKHNPRVPRGGELSDSYIQRGDFGISFEHKGSRPSTNFLRGGLDDRVLGPSESILVKLGNRQQVTLEDGRNQDNGFLT